MGEGVIGDDVAGSSDFAGEIGTLLDVASDEKKSCLDIVFSEDLEQAQSVRIVGTVVVGEGEFARVVREAGESFAIPLGSGRHGLVGRGRGGREGCGGGQGESEHVEIVLHRSLIVGHWSLRDRGDLIADL